MLLGLAKTLFSETHQRTPWLLQEKNLLGHSWPLFDHFLNQKRISYLDYILTHRLLRDEPNINEEVAFFICHLILSAREGHLCVKVGSHHVMPEPIHLWLGEEGQPFIYEEADMLNTLVLEGAHRIPFRLVTDVDNFSNENFPSTPICRYQHLFYLQRHWVFESIFLRHLKRHSLTKPGFEVDMSQVQERIQGLRNQGLLLEEQAQAIEIGCQHPLSFISGGPGTGKTYTAGHFVKIFWEALPEDQKGKCEIALAAPTGKAAANLQKSFSRVAAGHSGFPTLAAKTLHGLLGIKGTTINFQEKPSRLSADLILIDECSMIDVKLMARLFEVIKEGARLILLGDRHQLPPIEAGSLFADLIHLHAVKGLELPCTQLKTCMRAELKSIIDFAKMVHEGKSDEVLRVLQHSLMTGVHLFSIASHKREAQKAIVDHVLPEFLSIIEEKNDPQALLQSLSKIRLLSPLRKGPFGVDALNQLCWEKISKKAQDEWLPVPIMIVANDYQKDLFNGETGILMRKLPFQEGFKAGKQDYALFSSRLGDEVRRIPALLLPKYEYAYCLSIHKSQGSEFDKVILLMPEGSELFGREIFYTGVTRARKHLDIFGSDIVIKKTIEQQGLRLSGIEHRLFDH